MLKIWYWQCKKQIHWNNILLKKSQTTINSLKDFKKRFVQRKKNQVMAIVFRFLETYSLKKENIKINNKIQFKKLILKN